MTEFLWKLAGANCAILRDSDKNSQWSFRIIGQLFLTIICYVLIALTAVFTEISNSFLFGIILGAILTFLICNIYFINILDLEPRTLPRKKEEKKSLFLAYIVRYFSITLFALFVIKSMEIFLFEHLFIMNFQSDELIKELFHLHKTHPEIWLFTTLCLLLFYLPIFLKFQLNRNETTTNSNKKKSYFQIKKEVDIFIVQEDYKKFKKEREKVLIRIYKQYKTLNKLFVESVRNNLSLQRMEHQFRVRKPKFHESKFLDPPFNTIEKEINKEKKLNHNDFLNSMNYE